MTALVQLILEYVASIMSNTAFLPIFKVICFYCYQTIFHPIFELYCFSYVKHSIYFDKASWLIPFCPKKVFSLMLAHVASITSKTAFLLISKVVCFHYGQNCILPDIRTTLQRLSKTPFISILNFDNFHYVKNNNHLN